MRGKAEAALEAPAARLAAGALAGGGRGAWVVGGAVRDALLGLAVTDVDLAVEAGVESTARALADAAAPASAFRLYDDPETWRVASPEGWHLDLAALRGEGIEDDLRGRDFTVNAIAIPLGGGEVIDPTGGRADLEAERLRAASARAFADDPLRIMRAARLAAGLGLSIDLETIRLAAAESGRAGEPAGERQFSELRKLVAGPDPLRGLALLDELDATGAVLPELEALRGVGQSANHHLDVHGHTIEVLRRWLEVEADLEAYTGRAAAGVAAAIEGPLADELSRREGIRFATILHDIGKPATRTDREGFVGFRGHDAVGAEMIAGLCRRLRTSRRFREFLQSLTRHHLALGFMVHERPLACRRVWDYLSLTGAEAIDVTLLTVADRLSAQGEGVPDAAIEGHLELAAGMLAAAVELERSGRPEPLLRGEEIGEEVGIGPGPALGEAVEELAAAQYCGEVGDRAEAVEHLRGWRSSRAETGDR